MELGECLTRLRRYEEAEEHIKLSIEALGTYAESDAYLKRRFAEIKEMINSISDSSKIFSKFKKFFN